MFVFFNIFEKCRFVRIHFGMFGVFCTRNSYFEYGIRIRCILLYIGTWFKDFVEHVFQTCPRNVNNFHTKSFRGIFGGILGPKWSPLIVRRPPFSEKEKVLKNETSSHLFCCRRLNSSKCTHSCGVRWCCKL